MSANSQAATRTPERRSLLGKVLVREMWASLAISVIWLAVLFTAIFGPDITSHGNDGNATTIPSVVVVALFAAIATWFVAKYGFEHPDAEARR